MSYLPIEGSATSEVNENIYYQKLQKQLKERSQVNSNASTKDDASLFRSESSEYGSLESTSVVKKNKKETPSETAQYENFKDEVKLSSYEWTKKVLEQKDRPVQNLDRQTRNPKDRDLREFVQSGYSINFMKKVPELKEMYKFNIVESCSHQDLVGKFSQFKVGVIGQILALMGVPIEELKKLKKQAIQDAFDANVAEMSDNIYHEELSELIHGKTRKTKSANHIYSQYRATLTSQMAKLGRPGYWSNARVLEERAKQCYKIEQELSNERDALSYQLDYLLQESF